jgi:hypothetical protein
MDVERRGGRHRKSTDMARLTTGVSRPKYVCLFQRDDSSHITHLRRKHLSDGSFSDTVTSLLWCQPTFSELSFDITAFEYASISSKGQRHFSLIATIGLGINCIPGFNHISIQVLQQHKENRTPKGVSKKKSVGKKYQCGFKAHRPPPKISHRLSISNPYNSAPGSNRKNNPFGHDIGPSQFQAEREGRSFFSRPNRPLAVLVHRSVSQH